jgi:Lanthionine synthetase C-like protein
VLRGDRDDDSHDGGDVAVAALANWHPVIDAQRVAGRLPLVQDCHGAPGIVCRLAGAPRSPEWEQLLLAAGELSWRAGPLVKGASLCHGTAGTAIACLALFRRTSDELWLWRARALGMHCIEQVESARGQYGRGRQSLWTGDLGVACMLRACVTGEYAYPTLDVF